MTDGKAYSRRTFLKGAAIVAAMLPLGASLAGCAADGDPAPTDGSESGAADAVASDPVAADAAATPASGGVLVAYFSATGTTRRVAEHIAAHTGADLFEIAPVDPYTSDDLDYNDPDSRTSRERSDPNRSVELVQVTPDGFGEYDTVFVGYPIWWGDASWVVDRFVEGNDFSGKTVVPFCTSGSSPIGESGSNLAAMAATGMWVEGRRFAGSATAEEVASWIDGIAR